MKIKLIFESDQEKMSLFHTCLCDNGLIGLTIAGVQLEYDYHDMKAARERVVQRKQNEVVCYEDVLVEILEGGGYLKFVDTESGMDDVLLTKEQVIRNLDLVTPRVLLEIYNEEYDAVHTDIVMQTLIYGEVIFG